MAGQQTPRPDAGKRPQSKRQVTAADLGDTNVPTSNSPLNETQPVPPSEVDQGATMINNPAQTMGGQRPAQAKSQKPQAGKKKKAVRLGDFLLVKKLGQGGMGTVYLAKQVSLDRKVALKTLSKEFAKKSDFVKRFLRESRSMAKLQHPNVVQVYAADSMKGIHFAAIEYVDGQSMQDWMDQKKRLSVGDALNIILFCADALREAHDQNMIHRDIKPDNILLTSKGIVKVADFGLAKVLDEDVSMTQSGTGLGTPLYMAPEQARNAKHVDKRSDIYALGSTLYYFVTGKLPFLGESTLELIQAKEAGIFKSARKLNKEVPEKLDLMIDKMMAKNPEHRYADCSQIINDLQGLGLDNPTLSFISGIADSGVVTRGVGPRSSAGTSVPSVRRSAIPQTSAQDAARTTKKSEGASVNTLWFVRYKNPKKKVVVEKMSVAQIRAAMTGGTLDLKTQAKKTVNAQFLPLGQYPEFDNVVQSRAITESANARANDVKNIYKKLDKQDRFRKRFRWLRNLTDGIKGLITLIIWLAVVIGVLGLAGYYGWPHVETFLKNR